jgi:outer membrane protein assembly factor BamB
MNGLDFEAAMAAVVSHAISVPTHWSDSDNVKWTLPLPGAGSSSPIVIGERIFVTCYRVAESQLTRSLLCVDAKTGKVLWEQQHESQVLEDPYQGYLTEHGYASHTPVSDGNQVIAFFGKSGVHAFDMDGTKLWTCQVGTESGNRQWGSAGSLVLVDDLVIVNASEEARAIIAIDKATGKERWRAEAESLELTYGTPSVVTKSDGSKEIIIAVPGEVWGLNPKSGKLLWFVETTLTGNISPSPLVRDESIFVFGGYRSSGSYRIRSGGKGDATQTHVEWTSRSSSYVATPIHYDGLLFWIDDQGIAWCLDAENGKEIYRSRVPGLKSGGRPVYASPILAGGNFYVVTRLDGTLVIPAQREFAVLAQNHLAGDTSDFNATPAIYRDNIILRSNANLYSIGASKAQ